MKIQVIIGIVLLIVGAVLLTYDGFNTTSRENVINAGPIQVNADVERHHDVPRPVGWAVVAGGVILVALGAKGK